MAPTHCTGVEGGRMVNQRCRKSGLSVDEDVDEEGVCRLCDCSMPGRKRTWKLSFPRTQLSLRYMEI